MIEITLPYDTNMSKNNKFVGSSFTGKRLAYKSTYRSTKASMVKLASLQLKGKRFTDKTKTHIDMEVIRPDFRSDVHNILEALFDVLQEVTGVDDRYYQIEGMRWESGKVGSVKIKIWQSGEPIGKKKKNNAVV